MTVEEFDFNSLKIGTTVSIKAEQGKAETVNVIEKTTDKIKLSVHLEDTEDIFEIKNIQSTPTLSLYEYESEWNDYYEWPLGEVIDITIHESN